jgi:mannose-1-phosphate guanylyltransferase
MRRHCPEIARVFDVRRAVASYKRLPCLSIDYALMEKAKNIAVCPAGMDWCDMGNWDMLYEKSFRDKQNNCVEGFHTRGDIRDSLLVNQTQRPVIVLGVSGLIVVQTERGTLICRKGRAEEAALLSKKL